MGSSCSQFLTDSGASVGIIAEYLKEKAMSGFHVVNFNTVNNLNGYLNDESFDTSNQVNIFLHLLEDSKPMGESFVNYLRTNGISIEMFAVALERLIAIDFVSIKQRRPDVEEVVYLKNKDILFQIELLILLLITE